MGECNRVGIGREGERGGEMRDAGKRVQVSLSCGA